MVDDCLTITSCSLHSVKMNDLVQSKADTKRLELSDVKCFEMHIGDKKTSAPIKDPQQRNAQYRPGEIFRRSGDFGWKEHSELENKT